jgi:hypothetical protein
MRIKNVLKTASQTFIIMNLHSLHKIICLNPSTPVRLVLQYEEIIVTWWLITYVFAAHTATFHLFLNTRAHRHINIPLAK